MELLGQTRTGAYTFQSTLQEKNQNVANRFDESLSNNGAFLSSCGSPSTEWSSSSMRAPFRTNGVSAGRYNSALNYRKSEVLSEEEIPQLKNETRLTTLPSAKLTTEFLNQRNAQHGPITYAHEDWKISNSSNLCAADRTLAGSELMRTDAVRMANEMCDKTHKAQRDSTKRLDDRTKDVEHWKKELQDEFDKLLAETKEMEKVENCIKRALQEVEEPLKISLRCLEERKNRKEIDLVEDNVEKELKKEVQILKKVQMELKSNFGEIQTQIRNYKNLLSRLSDNIADKFAALSIDNACKNLKNTSKGIQNWSGANQNRTLDVENWVQEASDLIQESQNERAASASLRHKSNQVLAGCVDSMVKQWNEVNQAFSDRIAEYLNTKCKLENQLAKVLDELVDAQKTLEYLKKNLKDLKKPLQVAETRLLVRSQRPNSEACQDPAQDKLCKETIQIQESMIEMEAKLREAEFVEQELMRTKRCLEHELLLRNNSLFIDRDKCMGLRKSYYMSPKRKCF